MYFVFATFAYTRLFSLKQITSFLELFLLLLIAPPSFAILFTTPLLLYYSTIAILFNYRRTI